MDAQPVVLVVDDDGEPASMLAERLGQEGWQVHTALTGSEGERALAQHRPDAVVLDLMLSDANGLDLCRRWRAQHPALLRFKGLSIDLVQREVLAGGQAVTLTSVEFKLLVALARTPGQAMDRGSAPALARQPVRTPLAQPGGAGAGF